MIGRVQSSANVARRATKAKQQVLRGGLTRLNECHTFDWSRQLWADAGKTSSRYIFFAFVVYAGIMTYVLHEVEGLRGVDIPYFIITTMTTVFLLFEPVTHIK